MTTSEAYSRWALAPPIAELDDVRRALHCEIKRRQSDDDDEGDEFHDLLLLLCAQLFAARQPEDSLHIWAAKQCDFDAFCYIDTDFLCGAGVEETRAFLKQSDDVQAPELLEFIEGDWNNFRPEELLGYYRRYFTNTQEERE